MSMHLGLSQLRCTDYWDYPVLRYWFGTGRVSYL